jgi:hypothetical protein
MAGAVKRIVVKKESQDVFDANNLLVLDLPDEPGQ